MILGVWGRHNREDLIREADMLPMDEAISMDSGLLVAKTMGRTAEDPLKACILEGESAWVEAGKFALKEAGISLGLIEGEWMKEVGDDLTEAIENGQVRILPYGVQVSKEDVHIYTDGSAKFELGGAAALIFEG